jgi:hypothetical protein
MERSSLQRGGISGKILLFCKKKIN